MEIKKEQHTIRELTQGYLNNSEDGVIGFDGKLDIRPAYQREFVYKDKQRNLVIDSVLKGFPLNTMYWNTKDNGTYEVLDGQQRTISICEYVAGKFNVEGLYFNNQPDNIQKRILDYPLDIYKCKGTEEERIDWFQVINVAGETLTNQEILNAIYSGPWTTEAKKYFSKTQCPAYQIGANFISGSPIRQDYLETAIKWISNGDIRGYMGKHQHDTNADELWAYFKSIIDWAKNTFIGDDEKTNVRRKEMVKVDWNRLHREHGEKNPDKKKIQARVTELMADSYVKNKSGIYEYVLTGEKDPRLLDIRIFDGNIKRAKYEKQKGICPVCKKHFKLDEMQADHIKAWRKGGLSTIENCDMLCKPCNLKKGGG